MTSVQSFLRQRQTGQTILSGPTTAGTETYFVLNTVGTGNFVGNYPPGVMVDATAQLAALLALPNNGSASAPILRDMGKTISAALAPSGATATTSGFFRAVQVIVPSIVPSATSATNFGVIGSSGGVLPAGNSGDLGYATYYIPITVGSVVASNAAGTAALSISAAGLMLGEQL